jgi:hypothetical protein
MKAISTVLEITFQETADSCKVAQFVLSGLESYFAQIKFKRCLQWFCALVNIEQNAATHYY